MNDKRENSGPTPADAAAPSAGSTTSPQAGSGQALRKRAEELARTMSPTTLSAQTPEEIQRVFHELQVHQIELEMQNEELRAAQVQIEAGRARYFDLYDMAPVGYCTLSENGLILESNLTAATLLGTARGALVKQSLSRFILKEGQDIYYRHRKQLFETGEPQECDLRLVRPDGVLFWAHLWATVTQAEGSAPVCRMVLSDITERKRAEETLANERRLLRTLIDNLPVAVYIKDTQGRKTLLNRADLDNIGLPEEEVLGKTDAELFAPEVAARFIADDDAILRTGVPVHNREEFVLSARGKQIWQLTSKVPLRDAEGQIVGLIGIGLDITERKQAAEALQNSEQYLRTILQTTVDGFWVTNTAGEFLDINEAYCAMSGYAREEFLRLHISDIDALEDPADTAARIERVLENGAEVFETRHRRKDGSIFDAEVSVTYLDSAGGKLICFCRDITARKQAEVAILAERERLGNILAALETGLSLINPDMTIAWANRKIRELFPGHEPVGQICHRFYEGRETLCELCGTQAAFQTGEVQTGERQNPVTGRWYAIIAQPIRDAQGQVINVLEGVTDITARKQMVEALRASEEQHRRLFETMSPGVIYQAAGGAIISANPAAERIVGLTFDQMRGKTSLDLRWKMVLEDGTPVPGSDHPAMLALRTGEKVGPVIRCVNIPEKDAYVWLSITATPLFRPGEAQPFQAYATFDDITDRKQAEEENRRFRIISDNAVYGKAIADLHGNLLYVNRFFADIHGYEPEELIGKHLSLFHSREQMEVTARINAAMMQAGHYPPTEVWHLHRDGTEFPMLMSGIVIKDDYGNPQYIAASAIDIAAQLQAEEALHTTIYELKKSQEVAKVGNWVWHVSQNRVEWSDEMYRIFGIDKELFTGDLAQIVNDCIHPEDRAEVHRSNTSVMERNSPIPVEYRIIRPDGSVRTVWAEAGELELDGAGKPMLLRGIVHDITERKVAEEMLREREVHYRALAHENANLLHEVNHRVGNNMALLLALLDWAIDELTVPEARQALEHFRGRVESMAEVHRLLNKTQWAPIDLCTLIPLIICGVLATATTRRAVQYDVVCSDKAIYIPAKPAFKTALVLNELATNSLKYAFTHTNGGKLTVRVALDDPWIELVFADDGPGWPAAVLAGGADGMGLSLLRAIIEVEMKGTIALSNDHGAVVRLRFRAESEGSVNLKSGALAVP